MPQMSPMWWDFLYMIFITLFLLMNTMIFFIKKFNQSMIMNKTNKMMNWKW
uniref:ATP synthase F0 subunit 8 n=1 Tax=Iphicrates gressitti TaxID=2969360 RepID=UPI002176BC4D|nr:ATP synthase F0 subunit 8 [Iphicrates gressitti]UUJ37767.1 ATP synthase F0 subunit 8 [Iphicrates gressitti]